MHILITGGGGYLGGWVVSSAIARGHSVRVLDRFCFMSSSMTPERVFAEELASGKLELIQGDIRRLQEYPSLLDGIDTVIHLAGLSSDPTCDLDPEMAQEVNVECTRELARQSLQASAKRFLFASTCAVYGHGVFELLDEESPSNPVSVFAKTKLDAEQALLSMASTSFSPVVARMGTLFGFSRRMRFDLAVNHMVATAMRQKRILVRGGGGQWRPFIHVCDAAEALLLLAEAPDAVVEGEIFNVGTDEQNIRVSDLARLVSDALGGVTIDIAKDDDDLRNYRVRFTKLNREFRFQPQRGLHDGIEEVRHYLLDGSVEPFDEQYFNVDRMKRLRATPVDEGGEPVAARFIPLSRPGLGPEEEQAVLNVLRTGWLTSGPQVKIFEQMVADAVNSRFAVGVSSCTAALHLCLADLGIGLGDEVITSPITWASTGNTVLNMGASLRFVDVDPVTMNMDPARLKEAISERTKAIIPVHIAGLPCDMDAIRGIAESAGIPVIEDAAHAIGASYKGRMIGSEGPCCFSFYAIKNITTMEGGMITVNDADRANRLRLLAANGMTATAWDRYGRSAVPAPSEVIQPGFKYALGNVNAAMGIEQMKKFDTFRASRRRIAEMYTSVLAGVEEIEVPGTPDESEHAWHLYVIRLNLRTLTRNRNEIMQDLRRENIGTGVHFYGLHLHRYYADTLGLRPEDFPVSTDLSNRVISLPLHPQLSDRHIHEVVSALKKVLSYRRK